MAKTTSQVSVPLPVKLELSSGSLGNSLHRTCFSSCAVTNAEFAEVSTFYFGLESPCCAEVLGQRIGALRATVDPYGCNLTSVTLPGDGWRVQHDAIKWRICMDAKEMHARIRPEVYGLFAACIPQAGVQAAQAQTRRQRQGMVPDFLIHVDWDGTERPTLFELKTLHHGSTTYPSAGRRCEAVARRARALPSEYLGKAREADRRFCGTSAGEVGPVERKLRSFGEVRGLVFGAWGEASPDVERLLGTLADIGSQRHWRAMRCPDAAAAKGAIAWLLRRRWAFAALREAARLKIERLEHVGSGAAAAARRRSEAQAGFEARTRAAAVSSALRGPAARPGWAR